MIAIIMQKASTIKIKDLKTIALILIPIALAIVVYNTLEYLRLIARQFQSVIFHSLVVGIRV